MAGQPTVYQYYGRSHQTHGFLMLSMNTSRLRIAIGLTLVLVANGARLADIGAHASTALGLARKAGRCADAGPLFLRTSCVAESSEPTATGECRPDDAHGCYVEAMALQAHGQGDAAIAPLRRVVDAGYRLQFSTALLALQLIRHGDAAEAAAVWRRCPADDCETLLVRAGTPDTCPAAAALTHQAPRASVCMGALVRQAGHLEEALTWFRRALDGMVSGSAGESAALAHGLSRADVLYRMGETELVLRRLPEARRLTLECLAAAPEHYWGWFQWGEILAAEGDRAGAIRELERVVARYPEHGAAMMHLGMLYRSGGERAMAERWFLRARAVLPDKSLADVELRQLGLGTIPSGTR